MWLVKQRELHFERPMIMGILNVTPDSFSDGGRFLEPDSAVGQAQSMLEAGADIIDIGGESSRPGAKPIRVEEELNRVISVIKSIRSNSDCLISIDTRRSEIAREALAAGAQIVNDITGGTHDDNMFELIAESGAGYVMMHMQGTPTTMQVKPEYQHVLSEIQLFFKDRIKKARRAGINEHQIVLDPGIGFGKTLDHNLDILANMNSFANLGRPLLLGASRKSFIGLLDGSESDSRLGGSLAAVLASLAQGVQIFRVHDVAETRQAIDIFTAIQSHSD